MRRPLIAGNWKMNQDNREAIELARQLKVKLAGLDGVDLLVCPPATALASVCEILGGSAVAVGAQNLHDRRSGAFTGEISGAMIRSTGADWVLIGHSERRQFFGDDEDWIARKLLAAFECEIHPVLCIGETLAEREAGQLETVLRRQLLQPLENLGEDQLAKIIVAYEPVWAIGTGVVATPQQAQDAHALVRGLFASRAGQAAADRLRILYGGSVKPDNAGELLSCPDIDGALVGGASLDAASFQGIAAAATN